jgi:hypothetical protein
MTTGRTLRACALLVVLIVLITPRASRAQDSIVYVTAGPAVTHGSGNRDFAWQVGAGGETVKGPFSIGGEVDYLYLPPVRRTFDNGRGGSFSPGGHVLGFSVNGAIYPGNEAARQAQPFISGGVGMFVTGEALPTISIGAGVDWWAGRRTGLRFEVREQLPSVLTIRCGVVFR